MTQIHETARAGITVEAEFLRTRTPRLPTALLGPVLSFAFARLAANCLAEVISPLSWLDQISFLRESILKVCTFVGFFRPNFQ